MASSRSCWPTSKPADLNREAPAAKNELEKAEAEATGTEKDVGLARRKVDFALEGVASAQNGVTSLQELVDACTKQASVELAGMPGEASVELAGTSMLICEF
eukprot:g23989.t1